MDTLTTYQTENGWGCWTALAKAAGCKPSYISDLRRDGNRLPSLELAFSIEDATQGAIPARSWLNREAQP